MLITLEQFIEEQKKKLAAFELWYREQAAINSVTYTEPFPMAMDSRSWDEEYFMYKNGDSDSWEGGDSW